MNHELIAKCYAEDENFRKEYESLLEQKNKELDVVKKNYIPNFRGFMIKEKQIEAEFVKKLTDLCSKASEEKNA